MLDEAAMKALVHGGPRIQVTQFQRCSHPFIDFFQLAELDRVFRKATLGEHFRRRCL